MANQSLLDLNPTTLAKGVVLVLAGNAIFRAYQQNQRNRRAIQLVGGLTFLLYTLGTQDTKEKMLGLIELK